MKTLHEQLYNYYLVNPTRIDLGPMYFHSWWKKQGSRSS